METDHYLDIMHWTEDQLDSIPSGETDYYEYKSSLMPVEKLKTEITVAASAFWNSGGGIFLAGIHDDGYVDGGIPSYVGHQRLRDWADQILSHVEPRGPYVINTIESSGKPDSKIKPNHLVLIIGFGESLNAPHMAPDYRYYVRAGTHSLPAGHFLVEAIRARRGLNKPFLRGLFRMHPNKQRTVELVVIAANEAAALNVQLTFEPIPKVFAEYTTHFPLRIPIIDRDNTFGLDVGNLYSIDDIFDTEEEICMILHYEDVAGRKFGERQILNPTRSLSPVQKGTEDVDDIKKSLKEIVRQMKRFNKIAENTRFNAE